MRNPLTTLILLIAALGCSNSATQSPPNSNSAATATSSVGTVTFEIQTTDEVIRRTVDDISSGTTVEQVMKQITDLELKMTGSGTTALVTSMEGLTNGGSKGWTYRVDGTLANCGIGEYELTPPCTVTWKYGDFSEMD